MSERKPVICVYSNEPDAVAHWVFHDEKYRISLIHNLAVLEASINPSTNEFGDEFIAAVLDRSVSSRQYLELLARLAPEFRGDVLRIDTDGSGYLSTCAIRDGRFLYRLDADDVDFYLEARFGIPALEVLPEPVFAPLGLTA